MRFYSQQHQILLRHRPARTLHGLADLCRSEQIAFVLGHALYMKAIHGGKAKNDRIDAHKIATLPARWDDPPGLRVST